MWYYCTNYDCSCHIWLATSNSSSTAVTTELVSGFTLVANERLFAAITEIMRSVCISCIVDTVQTICSIPKCLWHSITHRSIHWLPHDISNVYLFPPAIQPLHHGAFHGMTPSDLRPITSLALFGTIPCQVALPAWLERTPLSAANAAHYNSFCSIVRHLPSCVLCGEIGDSCRFDRGSWVCDVGWRKRHSTAIVDLVKRVMSNR